MSDHSYLDWPFLNDDHRALAAEVDGWAEDHLVQLTQHEEADLDGTCKAIVRALGKAGLLRHAVPQSAGGINPKLDVRSLSVIRETLGRYHALADFAFAMQGLGSGPISLFGSEKQQQQYLRPISEGRSLAAFALSEPEAGSDVRAMTTTVVETDDHFVINGVKTWISNAGLADFYTVFARTGSNGGTKDICCFIVEADNPGLEVTDRIELMAPHPLGTLAFTDCKVPKEIWSARWVADWGSLWRPWMSFAPPWLRLHWVWLAGRWMKHWHMSVGVKCLAACLVIYSLFKEKSRIWLWP